MGKRGPIPKSKQLRALTGRTPLTKENTAIIPFNPPTTPEHLTSDQLIVWDRTLKELRFTQTIENIDWAVLEAYCTTYCLWVDAEKEIQKLVKKKSKLAGMITKGYQGIAINPLLNVSRRARLECIDFARQMGMTPASRIRAKVIETEVNPFKDIKNEN